MVPDFHSATLATIKEYFSNPKNITENAFSLAKNSFVLKDNKSERLVLYKGPTSFSDKLKSIGPVKILLLRGKMSLRILPFIISTNIQGTARRYNTTSKIYNIHLVVNNVENFEYHDAMDMFSCEDAIWLMQFEKSAQHSTCITFNANSLQVDRVSLLYHSHSRLFNYVEVLARSTCNKSFDALKLLTASVLDELAWKAIEGLHHRDAAVAKQLLVEYAETHPSEVVQQRAAILSGLAIKKGTHNG